MIRIFNFIFFVCAALLLGACSDSREADIPLPELTILGELPALDAGQGFGEVHFSAGENWSISTESPCGDKWYDVSPLTGPAGNKIAYVFVYANESYESRKLTLTIRTASQQKQVEIVQEKMHAVLTGKSRYEISHEEQTLPIAVQANVDYEIEIAEGGEWIAPAEDTRSEPGLTTTEHRFTVAANNEPTTRSATILFRVPSGDLQDEVTVVQAAWEDPNPEREALLAIYRDTGGDNWTLRDNWCSDRPMGEWYGVKTDDEGHVTELRLPHNNLAGTIPAKLSRLTHLRHIDLSHNALNGALCVDFTDNDLLLPLAALETADFSYNAIGGTLSISWQNLRQLTALNLSSNNIEGGIPAQWRPMFTGGRAVDLILYGNYLYGDIPSALTQCADWDRLALQIVRQRILWKNGSPYSILTYSRDITIPDIGLTLADGSQQNLRAICSANKMTMLLHWNPLQERSDEFVERVVRRFHKLFGSTEFAVVALTPAGEEYREAAEQYIRQHDIPWTVAVDCTDAAGKRPILLDEPYPSYLLLDNTGRMIEEMADGNYGSHVQADNFTVDLLSFPHTDYLNSLFKEKFGKSAYESTDYSRDKQYETIQRATRGKGIDIVLMGEAFTDTDIESGMYRDLMILAEEALFRVEPMKSYRDYFNVHIVYAVSKKPFIGNDRTQVALGTVISSINQVDNNRKTIAQYAFTPVIDKDRDPIPCVIINDDNTAVTMMNIYGMYPNYAFIGYRYGSRISATRIAHETIGHALGLLGDEYANPMLQDIPSSVMTELKDAQANGCFLNLSLTNNPNNIPWAHLIGHSDFPYVGIYDGGYGYYQVWRSEYSSIMDGSLTWYFNAISRELLVRRILALAGEEYTFEKFLEKDSDEGRPKTTSALSPAGNRNFRTADSPHCPPIFYDEQLINSK